jgi:hypothetical protein
MPEAHVLIVDEIRGVRHATRHSLAVPVEAARGRFERLSDRALNDLIKDLAHEQMRRQGWLTA